MKIPDQLLPAVKLLWRVVIRTASVAVLLGLAGAFSPWHGVKYISNSKSDVDVFLVAHQDDWQLFMGDIVMKKVRTGNRIVFIYLTAGDDGRDSLYWRTREWGALQATRLTAGVAATDSMAVNCAMVEVLAHSIRKCALANTESYFLRLPDGKRNGEGFAAHGYQSLRRLRGKRISAITAVDGSATYHSWGDLMAVAGSLVDGDSADVTVHTNDPNVIVNPHDHFDHRMAGLLVADSRKKKDWNVLYYVGYALATRAVNRSNDQARQKTALFLAYEREMLAVNKTWGAYQEHPTFYSECMLRTYARKARKN